MLTLNSLDVKIGKRVLLPGVNALWKCGTLLAVLGPNGVGKSTLLNHVAGVALSTAGQVSLHGEDIFTMAPLTRARRIASIAQHDTAGLETITRDRIEHGLYSRAKTVGFDATCHSVLDTESKAQPRIDADAASVDLAEESFRGTALSSREGFYFRLRVKHGVTNKIHSIDQTRVETIAQKLGISDLLSRGLYSLSGGQRKKVHIARALVDDRAEVYVLDEPDASLDATSREAVMFLLREIARSGKLVIVSLHHPELALAFADEILDLNSLLRRSQSQ
jgi:iron complex transport system ATP-binding protein